MVPERRRSLQLSMAVGGSQQVDDQVIWRSMIQDPWFNFLLQEVLARVLQTSSDKDFTWIHNHQGYRQILLDVPSPSKEQV
jgi:hypothetical protein